MSGWRFTLRRTPALRVDLRGVLPSTLATLTTAQVERLPLGYGRELLPLAEFFVALPLHATGDEGLLHFDADLARFDRVGWSMDAGRIDVAGGVGHYAGGCMSAGEMRVEGSAGLLAACEMSGGRLVVGGDVDDFAASTLPGSMDGMRGGLLVVKGRAGARFGDRMRRGTAWVWGDAGDFLGARMVAGTIALGGRAGAHAGWGMRRGSIVWAGDAGGEPPASFVPAGGDADVAWQLIARSLAVQGGPFAGLARRPVRRWLGDLAAGGKGELIRVLDA